MYLLLQISKRDRFNKRTWSCHLATFYTWSLIQGSQRTNNLWILCSLVNLLKCENCISIWPNEFYWSLKRTKCVQYINYVFNTLSFGCILISDLVVADLFMCSLSGIFLLYLAGHFYTKGVFTIDFITFVSFHVYTI